MSDDTDAQPGGEESPATPESDSPQTQTETQAETQAAQTGDGADSAQPKPAPDEGAEGKGRQPVDFDELPEAIREKFEPRFKRIYGHMKQYERENGELKGVIEEQTRLTKALDAELKKFRQETTQKEAKSEIATLRTQRREAMENGEYDRVDELDERIFDLRMQAQAKPEEPEPEKSPEPEKKETPGWLTQEVQARITEIASETDDNGDLKRPWVDPAHPEHRKAIDYLERISNHPKFLDADVDEYFAALDKYMTPDDPEPKKKQPAAAVMESDSSIRPKPKKTVELTPEALRVAEMMGYSKDEYAKLMEKHNG